MDQSWRQGRSTNPNPSEYPIHVYHVSAPYVTLKRSHIVFFPFDILWLFIEFLGGEVIKRVIVRNRNQESEPDTCVLLKLARPPYCLPSWDTTGLWTCIASPQIAWVLLIQPCLPGNKLENIVDITQHNMAQAARKQNMPHDMPRRKPWQKRGVWHSNPKVRKRWTSWVWSLELSS